MESKPSENVSEQQKNLRTLTLALIFSGTLNISLIAAGLFTALKNKDPFELPKQVQIDRKAEATNRQILESFSKLGFRELVSYLTNRDFVEEGYAKRDFAVAALVSYYHFNIEKALGSVPAQQRKIELGAGQSITLFPALSEEQHDAIIRFAYQEKWPLTSEGLFQLLRKWPKPRDPTLEQAFFISPEFYKVQTLFQKTEAAVAPSLLLDLVCDGNWELLSRFGKEQEDALDLSVDKRRRFLVGYLALRSQIAAQILLTTDFAFALKRLEDVGILALLGLLNRTPEAERFCIELVRSPRSDAVWTAASEKLYSFAGETLPAPFDLKAALTRFGGAVPAAVETVPPPPVSIAAPAPKASAPPKSETRSEARTHVVKEGESLWKISRQYKVHFEEIVKFNGLDKEDRIYPGMTLKIPPAPGS